MGKEVKEKGGGEGKATSLKALPGLDDP